MPERSRAVCRAQLCIYIGDHSIISVFRIAPMGIGYRELIAGLTVMLISDGPFHPAPVEAQLEEGYHYGRINPKTRQK